MATFTEGKKVWCIEKCLDPFIKKKINRTKKTYEKFYKILRCKIWQDNY